MMSWHYLNTKLNANGAESSLYTRLVRRLRWYKKRDTPILTPSLKSSNRGKYLLDIPSRFRDKAN